MALIRTSIQIANTIKSASRLKTIVAAFARHGFQNTLEKANLGKFVFEKLTQPSIENFSAAERMRMVFEELGPTFVKFGQVLASRPDLIPDDFVDEFKKLHHQVSPLTFEEVKAVLELEYGKDYSQVFLSIEEQPLASASIAQVHRAKLRDGSEVVVKVQRPGIAEVIQEDLAVLHNLAGLVSTYVPELKALNPVGIVNELFRTLELETNFVIEAHNIIRFQKNFENDPQISIPKVNLSLSTEKVLVMEELKGVPLSHAEALKQEGVDRDAIMQAGLHSFLRMVFKDGFFHGDLHAGNLIILPNKRIGLIDFGVVGRLNDRTKDAVTTMFLSIATNDYERLAYEFIDIAPYTDAVDADQFARDLRNLLAPYLGLSLKNVNMGRMLMEASRIANRHGLQMPSELILFFKSVVTVEGMAKLVQEDFDLLPYAMKYVNEIAAAKYDPTRIVKDLTFASRDTVNLLSQLPRQFKQIMRGITSPGYHAKVSVPQLEDLQRSVQVSASLNFLAIVIGSLIVGGAIALQHSQGPQIAGLPAVSFFCFTFAVLTSLLAFYNYIRK